MMRDHEAIIDDLLRQWHLWSIRDHIRLGYPEVSPACALYRASRQYDTENGALDTDAHCERMQMVEHCVFSLNDPYRTAVCINARNLATGQKLWTSARLPQDTTERAMIVAQAREMLARRLQADGLC